jgi:prepilin-type N-terminal cleavage/methylation domain-containing protein
MRRLRSDQSGFTLIEMLVSCTLGLIVLTAALQLMDVAQRSAKNTTERADDAQRGRVAMEQIVQGLNSEVCARPTPTAKLTPLVYGDGTKLVFYRDIAAKSGTNNTAAFLPDQHTYQLVGDKITDVTNAGVGTYPNVTFPTASAPRLVAEGVALPTATPLFTYYAYQPDGTIDPAKPLPTPLGTTDLSRVVQIRIRFVTRPTDKYADKSVEANFDDSVTTALPVTPPQPSDAVQNWIVSCPI